MTSQMQPLGGFETQVDCALADVEKAIQPARTNKMTPTVVNRKSDVILCAIVILNLLPGEDVRYSGRHQNVVRKNLCLVKVSGFERGEYALDCCRDQLRLFLRIIAGGCFINTELTSA